MNKTAEVVPVLLEKGTGYWLTVNYPIGGCFRRSATQKTIYLTGESRLIKGYGYLSPFRFNPDNDSEGYGYVKTELLKAI